MGRRRRIGLGTTCFVIATAPVLVFVGGAFMVGTLRFWFGPARLPAPPAQAAVEAKPFVGPPAPDPNELIEICIVTTPIGTGSPMLIEVDDWDLLNDEDLRRQASQQAIDAARERAVFPRNGTEVRSLGQARGNTHDVEYKGKQYRTDSVNVQWRTIERSRRYIYQ